MASQNAPSRSLSFLPVLRVFYNHAKVHPWMCWVIFFGTIGDETLSSVILPYVLKLLLDGIVSASDPLEAGSILMPILWTFIGISVTRWLIGFVLHRTNILFQSRVMAKLEQTSFAYLLGHSYQFFQDTFGGSLVRKITRLSRSFEDIGDNIQQKLLPIIVTIIGVLYVVFRQNTLIGWIVCGWIAIVLTYNFFHARRRVSFDVARAEQDSACSGFLADTISNVITVKLFTGGDRERKGFKKASDRLSELRHTTWRLFVNSYAWQSFTLIVIQGVVLVIGIRYWMRGIVTAGDIILFLTYFEILSRHMIDFARMLRSMYSAFADASEMVEIMDTPHAIQDRPGAKILRAKNGTISFKNVEFSYQEQPVIKRLNLEIAPGEKIGLVGSSGAGKSTFVKLLLRFYDVTRGQILIDGQNISEVTQDSLRKQIALVPQEPILFHRTLMENIRYGRPNASDQEVRKAAKLAHCDEFIQDLPKRYQTYVGERGIKLSGGERQRIAIARAMLKNAPILVLDEATSSLDSESERLIQNALQTLMEGKTSIVIAHRLSTIMSMDRIIILQNGEVVDMGTHQDLLHRKGIYKKLWDIQAGGFLE